MDETTPPVTLDIDLTDMQAFWNQKRQSHWKKVFAVVFYGLILVVLADLLHVYTGGADPDAAAAGLFGVLAGVAGCLWALVIFNLFYTQRSQRKLYKGSIIARGPITFRGDDHAIEAVVAEIISTHPWSSFVRMSSTPTHYFLYASELQPIILRRAAVAGTPLGELVEDRISHGL